MTTLLITIHVIACVVLILVVLLQAGRGADMGAAFGGASSPMFGAGSSTNPLARVTTATAVTFLATALLLAVASARRASVFDDAIEPLAVTPQAESSAPVAGAQPGVIPATDGAEESAPVASDQAAGQNAPTAATAPSDAVPESAPAEVAKDAAPTEAVKEAASAAVLAPVEEAAKAAAQPTAEAAAPVAADTPSAAVVPPTPSPEAASTPPAQ